MTNSELPNLRAGEHLSGFQMPVCVLAAVEPPGQDLPLVGQVINLGGTD